MLEGDLHDGLSLRVAVSLNMINAIPAAFSDKSLQATPYSVRYAPVSRRG